MLTNITLNYFHQCTIIVCALINMSTPSLRFSVFGIITENLDLLMQSSYLVGEHTTMAYIYSEILVIKYYMKSLIISC